MPSRMNFAASGRLANLSSGVIASLARYTRLMRPGFFGSGLSVANRHGRWKFRNGLRSVVSGLFDASRPQSQR